MRAIRADEIHLDPENLTSARQSLENEISSPHHATPTRRRALRWGLGLGGAGIANAGTFAVIAIVGGSVVAPLSDQPASASEILEQAAAATLDEISAADQPLAPGQYLKVSRVTEQVITNPDLMFTAGGTPPEPETCAAFTVSNVTDIYVPADRSADWIVDTQGDVVTDYFGPKGEELKTAYYKVREPVPPSVWSHPNGAIMPEFGTPEFPYTFDAWREKYAEVPRDPAELFAWFEARSFAYDGFSEPSDLDVVNTILWVLQANLPPADLRAAMLQAIADSEVFEVMSVSDSTATWFRPRNQSGGPTSRPQSLSTRRTGTSSPTCAPGAPTEA